MAPRRIATALCTLAASWYCSLAVHEFGHALAGMLAGAASIDISLPLLGFSQTQFTGNEHPLFTTAAGLVVGGTAPWLLWRLAKAARLLGRDTLRFWAGFALVFNGGYLAGDSLLLAGDAAELARAGVPVWLMLVVGALTSAGGFWIWHTLDRRERIDRPEERSVEAGFTLAAAGVMLGMGLVLVAIF